MKKLINYIGLALFAMILLSCSKKDDFNYPAGTVGISKITNYAEFTLSGDEYVYIKKGDPYVDPGVVAKEGDATLPVTTTGLPNINVAGVYAVTYSATNKDGFSASAFRTVVVYDTKASAADNDFSGTYARSSNGSESVWTKVKPGVYMVFNPGGAPGTNVTLIAFNQEDYDVYLPEQLFGSVFSSDLEESTPGATPGTLAQYKWKIVNVGYGPAVRTFDKL